MSGMKASMLGIYAGAIAALNNDMHDMYGEEPKHKLTKQELEDIAKYRKAKRQERKAKRGIQEFWYGEVMIEARNQKNADRKARNQGIVVCKHIHREGESCTLNNNCKYPECQKTN